MSTQLYWVGKTVVVDWPLTDLADPPAPVTDATLAGVVTLPDATTDPMVAAQAGDVARFTYDPTIPGLHAYRLEATGTAVSAAEGTFYVKPSPATSGPAQMDPTTEVGQVRLLIADVDEDNLLLSDAQVAGFLALEDGVKRAAAAALETIAVSEVLVAKVIRTADGLSVDGAKVSAELRARAKDLRAQAALDDDNADGGFEIVDFDPTPDLSEFGFWRVP